MVDKPRPRARHELGIVEHRGGFAPKIGNKAALGMFAGFRSAKYAQGRRLMVEQRARRR